MNQGVFVRSPFLGETVLERTCYLRGPELIRKQVNKVAKEKGIFFFCIFCPLFFRKMPGNKEGDVNGFGYGIIRLKVGKNRAGGKGSPILVRNAAVRGDIADNKFGCFKAGDPVQKLVRDPQVDDPGSHWAYLPR